MKNLNLFGIVYSAPDCINATQVSDFLSKLNDNEEFTVYINSPGGEVFEGLAIYNLLSEYASRMTVKIIGQASSIASVIASAGAKGKVLIAETAMMLIHNPWTFAIVDEQYLKKLDKELGSIKSSIIKAYISKTSNDEMYLSQLMTDNDYLDAEKCVEVGLADMVYDPTKDDSKILKQSDALVKKALQKYTIMNLSIEKPIQNNDLNNLIGDTMFKNLEEAALKYNELSQKSAVNEAEALKYKDAATQFNEKLKIREAELNEVKASKDALEQQFAETSKINAELKEKNFINDAKMACDKFIKEGKLTKAEVDGKADTTKELPAKVTYLLNLRRAGEELYNAAIADIESRPALDVNALSQGFDFQNNAGVNNDDLDNFIVNVYNKKGRK